MDCKACDLWERGTQTVFGEGRTRARVVLVGEQPGNDEDLAGKPFVGPAGRLLDRALEEAGIDRSAVYITNVVKHFKWEPRGKRRIHKKPNGTEIVACRPWLDRAVPDIPHWQLSALPRYLVPADVERVIACCDLTKPLAFATRQSCFCWFVSACAACCSRSRSPGRETRHAEPGPDAIRRPSPLPRLQVPHPAFTAQELRSFRGGARGRACAGRPRARLGRAGTVATSR